MSSTHEDIQPEIQKDDLVEVVFRSRVTSRDWNRLTVTVPGGATTVFFDALIHGESVTKIEEIIETFQPGDVVRSRNNGQVFALVDNGRPYGYICTTDRLDGRLRRGKIINAAVPFTSREFERAI